MMNKAGILPARIREFTELTNDLIPKMTEDEADYFVWFIYQMAAKHNQNLEG